MQSQTPKHLILSILVINILQAISCLLKIFARHYQTIFAKVVNIYIETAPIDGSTKDGKYYVPNAKYKGTDDSIWVNGSNSLNLPLGRILVHELIHRATITSLGPSEFSKNCNPKSMNTIINLGFCTFIPQYPNVTPAYFEAFTDYAGWYYDLQKDRYILSDEDRKKVDQFKIAIGTDMNETENLLTNSALYNPYEHSAELGRFYYLDSKLFKDIWPDVYPLYHEILFDGKTYKDEVWINP